MVSQPCPPPTTTTTTTMIIMYLYFQTISKFGKLDILVSNAAVNPTFGPTLEVIISMALIIESKLYSVCTCLTPGAYNGGRRISGIFEKNKQLLDNMEVLA